MSQIYTYSSLSSRARRQKRQREDELGLFKMATICGYPGASSSWLPFIHSSFPASPTIPPPKCYTFSPRREQTSLSKKQPDDNCKAIVCCEEREIIQLPEIPQVSDERRNPHHIENGYVNKNKVCFRLKGINPKQLYAANRSKPNVSVPHRHSLECLTISPHRSSTLMDFSSDDSWNKALESIAKATFHGAASNKGRDWDQQLFREPSSINMTVQKKFEDERRHISSGLKGKKLKDGRPLGHVVSPKRMNSILQDNDRTLPYTYYKTDMAYGR